MLVVVLLAIALAILATIARRNAAVMGDVARAPAVERPSPVDVVVLRDGVLVIPPPSFADVRVHIVDARGEPWTGAVQRDDAWRNRDEPPTDAPSAWPTVATLVVVPASADVEPGAHREARLLASRGEDGVFRVQCRSGDRYRIGLMGGAERWRPREFVVSTLATSMDVKIVATWDAALGALEVRVRDAAGAALTGPYSIRVEDVDDGAPLVHYFVERSESGSGTRRLPAGTYRVVVHGEPDVGRQHGVVHDFAAHGRFETIVEVRQDETTTLLAPLPAGARLRAKIAGAGSPADEVAVRAQHPPTTVFGGPIEFWSERATMSLVADGRWPVSVFFRWEMTSSSGAGTHLGDWLLLGKGGTSELLPAGRYRFEARLPGGRSASADIVLVDGQTTDVELAIEPR